MVKYFFVFNITCNFVYNDICKHTQIWRGLQDVIFKKIYFRGKKLFSWRILLIKKHCNRSNIKWEHKQIKDGFDVDPFEGKTDRTETAKVKKTQKQ